jgi:hypothetical protein
MTDTAHVVGFVATIVASAGKPDSFGNILTLEEINNLATKSAGLCWVEDGSLVTHVLLESTNKFRLDG